MKKFDELMSAGELSKKLLFEERNKLYLTFFVYISALKLASSFFYMAICANRHADLMSQAEIHLFTAFFEVQFLIEMLLQFLRKITPDGAAKPLESI